MRWGQWIVLAVIVGGFLCSCNQTPSNSTQQAGGKPAVDRQQDKEPQKPADTSAVLAKVGDKEITSADLDKKLEEIPTYARTNFLTKDGKLKLLDRLIRNELLLRAAEEAGYENRPDIQEKLRDAKERILTSEYFKNEMNKSHSSSDEEISKYYEQHKEDYKTEEEAEVRHILLDTEVATKELREKILKNEITFENAVKEYSKDAETKDSDGKLGAIRKGGFVKGIGRSKEFDDAVFALKPGEISNPISSRKGYHLVKVESIKPSGYKPLEEVKVQISEELMITDDVIEKEYKDNPDEYKSRARVKLRHIQVETEPEAQKVAEQLKNGTSFDELVEKFSVDASSVKQKGNLGFLYKDGYIRGIGKDMDFEKKVFDLKTGEYSAPIKSQKGWHIVVVDEKTEEVMRPLEEVRSQIKSKLLRDAKERGTDSRFDELKKKYQVQIFEEKIVDSKPEEIRQTETDTVHAH